MYIVCTCTNDDDMIMFGITEERSKCVKIKSYMYPNLEIIENTHNPSMESLQNLVLINIDSSLLHYFTYIPIYYRCS